MKKTAINNNKDDKSVKFNFNSVPKVNIDLLKNSDILNAGPASQTILIPSSSFVET